MRVRLERAWRWWRGGLHNSTATLGCLSATATVVLLAILFVLAATR